MDLNHLIPNHTFYRSAHTSSSSASLRLSVLELLELGLAEVVDQARADGVAQHVDRRAEPEMGRVKICFNLN